MHDDAQDFASDTGGAPDAAQREAALRQVLQMISRSRAEEGPIFDTILENALRLCRAPLGFLLLTSPDRSALNLAAIKGEAGVMGGEIGEPLLPMAPERIDMARVVTEAATVHVHDFKDSWQYREGDPERLTAVDDVGIRSFLGIPLVLDGQGIGCITLYRREVRPFNETEITLVEAFADQAVIAIENARQFREVQTRLEREKASAEILEVISQSRDDELPVFEAILERAARLCEAEVAGLNLPTEKGDAFVLAARIGSQESDYNVGDVFDPNPRATVTVALREGRTVHIPDMEETELFREGDPHSVQMVEKVGIRTRLVVPLLSVSGAVGAISLNRLRQKPFSQDEISLVESFAAQAVIAIENVRQFREVQTLNAELGDRVEAQVEEIERMGRLKRFLPEQVADAVVSSGDESALGSHRALVAALFCDMRGFTAFCETAEPEETIEVLQTYHERLGALIAEHGAGVDHRAGDGIMVLFNDPLPCDDPAGDAVRLAFAMRAEMANLCTNWRKLGHRLGFGVGISLGYATVGMVGSEGRFHYTASGTVINLAARLCDMAGDGEILLSPRAFVAVEDQIDGAQVGAVELKGISAPVEVFRADTLRS